MKPYVNGSKNGIEKEYYENGQIKSETLYVNGSKNGIKKEYYESGKLLSEFTYVDGEMEGDVKLYNPDGKMIYSKYYSNGASATYFYTEDGISHIIPYLNGKINGIEKWYDQNGNETKHQNYVRGYKANDDGVLYESEYQRMLMDQHEESQRQLKAQNAEVREQLKKQADKTEALTRVVKNMW